MRGIHIGQHEANVVVNEKSGQKSVQIRTTPAERKAIRELADRLENDWIGQDDRNAAAALLRRMTGMDVDGAAVARGRPRKRTSTESLSPEYESAVVHVLIRRIVHGESYQDAIFSAAEKQARSERTISNHYSQFVRDMAQIGLSTDPVARAPLALKEFLSLLERPDNLDCGAIVRHAVSLGTQCALDKQGIERPIRPIASLTPDFAAMEAAVLGSVISYFLNTAFPKGAARRQLRDDAEKLAFTEAFARLKDLKDLIAAARNN